MRYLKSGKIWMSEDGTLYAADKVTVIGKGTILNRFRPGPKEGTWIDTRGNLYGSDRKAIIKTADELARERARAQAAARAEAKAEAERLEKEQQSRQAREAAALRRIANREGQKRINELKLQEAFGIKASE